MSDLREYSIAQFEALTAAAQRRQARARIAMVVDTATGSRSSADHFKQSLAALEAATNAD